MLLPYFVAFVGLLKSTAWSIVALLLFFMLRHQIRDGLPDLMSRARKFGPTGAEFAEARNSQVASRPEERISSVASDPTEDAHPAGTTEAEPVTSAQGRPSAGSNAPEAAAEGPTRELRQFEMGSVSPPLARLIVQLRANLQDVQLDARQRVLLHDLAETRLLLSHERTYRAIFGSQMLALEHLERLGPVTSAQAVAFFNSYTSRWTKFYEGYGFEGWSNFLVRSNLVSEQGGMYRLTDVGSDFLRYTRAQGLVLKPA